MEGMRRFEREKSERTIYQDNRRDAHIRTNRERETESVVSAKSSGYCLVFDTFSTDYILTQT